MKTDILESLESEMYRGGRRKALSTTVDLHLSQQLLALTLSWWPSLHKTGEKQ